LPHIIEGYRSLARRRRYLLPAVISGLPSAGLFAFFAGAPVVFIETLGMTPSQFGVLAVVAVVGVLLGSLSARYLPGRVSPAGLLTLGMLFTNLGGAGMLVLALTDSMTAFNILGAMTLYLYGMGVLLPTGLSIALQQVDASEAGSATALSGFVQMLGAAAGTLFVSLLGAWPSGGFALVMAGVGVVTLVLLIAARGDLRHAQHNA
jgi:DHA1 family bicyclomycin/chloramphenicol resistance-like MFS transporter